MPKSYGVTVFFAVCVTLVVFAAGSVSRVGAHGWQAPKTAAAVENPVSPTAKVIQTGKAVFKDFCTACHGADARGANRPVSPGSSPPPDLVRRLAGHSQGDFFWKINQGRGDMPGFGEDLSPEEIWSVIRYIDSLSK